MKNFEINEEYLCSVIVHRDYILDKPEDEQVIARLKGDVFSSTWFEDHPEFIRLREQLHSAGYIEIQRNCSNGDTVIKPFALNGNKFKKGDRFVCAPAMKFHITSKYKR